MRRRISGDATPSSSGAMRIEASTLESYLCLELRVAVQELPHLATISAGDVAVEHHTEVTMQSPVGGHMVGTMSLSAVTLSMLAPQHASNPS